jgi:hypothetical protein
LTKHDDIGIGLNYWFSDAFVIKTSVHFVSGNRFAVPRDVARAAAAGTLETQTRLLMVGAQFAF